jgi:hypothetical protein
MGMAGFSLFVLLLNAGAPYGTGRQAGVPAVTPLRIFLPPPL